MSSEDEGKKLIIKKFRTLNEFIRGLEDFANANNISIENDKVYLVACGQRDMLKELIEDLL